MRSCSDVNSIRETWCCQRRKRGMPLQSRPWILRWLRKILQLRRHTLKKYNYTLKPGIMGPCAYQPWCWITCVPPSILETQILTNTVCMGCKQRNRMPDICLKTGFCNCVIACTVHIVTAEKHVFGCRPQLCANVPLRVSALQFGVITSRLLDSAAVHVQCCADITINTIS